jgi:hypothetical protein
MVRSTLPILSPSLQRSLFRQGIPANKMIALAEHNRRRSSSTWSLHSSNSGGTSKTEVLKDLFRRGSQSQRKSTSQDGIAEGKEGEEEEEAKA